MPVLTSTQMLGATPLDHSNTEFKVWAPNADQASILIVGETEAMPMRRESDGIWRLQTRAAAGDQYFVVIDDSKPLPDPVSRFLPQGIHGPTEIVDPEAYEWHDEKWRGLPLEHYIIYELHPGTFSPEGTFDGVVQKLSYLRELGVTAIEIMPVAAFPGERNWGYDGVALYAVQASYGGPAGLKRLVDAAHQCGLAVILDVVYNHFGNEGNYLRQFGPYFTDKHKTPWGDAINYDQPGSQQVRRFIVENARYWIREYHLDGLRLDAVQTIKDDSPVHVAAEIKQNIEQLARELGRTVCVIAETDENDTRYVRKGQAAYGLDAVWSDDFHHAFHVFLTGEHKGYYQDYGRPEQLVRVLNDGFAFQGEEFKFWGRPRGTSSSGMAMPQHVICIQNHDQIGNRALGERLGTLVPEAALFGPAAFLLLAPHTPLLFMGQEYDETAPFQFFTNYSDPALQEAVRKGRREEFKDFGWDEVPDPEDPATFQRSKLNWDLALRGSNEMLKWYRDLIALRKRLIIPGPRTCRAAWREDTGVLSMQAPAENPRVRVVANLRPERDRQRRHQALAVSDSPAETWKQSLGTEHSGYEVRVYQAE
jgi:maltooligosyltrehalose trehalohydrolase